MVGQPASQAVLGSRPRKEPSGWIPRLHELLIIVGSDEHSVGVTPQSSDGGVDVCYVLRAGGTTELDAAVQVKHGKEISTFGNSNGSLESACRLSLFQQRTEVAYASKQIWPRVGMF